MGNACRCHQTKDDEKHIGEKLNTLNIRPFDLILFRGTSWVSRGNMLFQQTYLGSTEEWSHVGIAVTKEILPGVRGLKSGHLYVLESQVGGGSDDVVAAREIDGVQLRDMVDVLRTYESGDGTIAWCTLINHPLDRREGEGDVEYECRVCGVKEIFVRLFHRVWGRPYDYLGPFAGLFPCLRCLRKTPLVGAYETDAYFCSELAAEVYRSLGVAPYDTNASDMVPLDFVESSKDTEGVPALVALPPVIIDRATTSL